MKTIIRSMLLFASILYICNVAMAQQSLSDRYDSINEAIDNLNNIIEMAESPCSFSGALDLCGTTLDKYRIQKDGITVLPDDFKWNDLSDE